MFFFICAHAYVNVFHAFCYQMNYIEIDILPSCRTEALQNFLLLTDRRTTVPPITKMVYLLRRKSLDLISQYFTLSGEIPDDKFLNIFIFCKKKNTNRPLVHSIRHCRFEISSSNLSFFYLHFRSLV